MTKSIFAICLQASITACLCIISILAAADMASTNYAIHWDVTDSGGGTSDSTNYRLATSMGQPSVTGEALSTHYGIVTGFEAVPDSDADTIRDTLDNCMTAANSDQRDTDNDGFGNRCDPDFDGNLVVNAADLAYLKSKFFSTDPDADLNGNGVVNAADLAILKSMFFKAPGPSGLVP